MQLAQLGERRIAVDLHVNGERRVVRGIGIYEPCTGSKGTLRIEITESAGDFEIVLDEDGWKGQIVADHEIGCDYRICLSPAPASVIR